MKKIVIIFFMLILFPINVFSLSYNCKSCLLMDVDSGRVLYSKDENTPRLIASITKIMTAIIVLENMDLDKRIIVGDEVLNMYGTNIYVKVGEELSVRDLLYGLMLRSGNDAAIVLAVNTSGSEMIFVDKMNEKAKQLGMSNTFFQNCHGLDDETKNYSTAHDMAILSRYAFQNEKYRKIISTRKYVCKSSFKSYIWYNRVSLLTSYKYCVGGKNGYTPKAGKTLVSYAKKGDLILMAVTLNDSEIYDTHKRIYNDFFEKYSNYLIVDKDSFGLSSFFSNKNLYLKKSFKYPLTKSEISNVSTVLKLFSQTKDNVVGKIVIKYNDEEIGNVKIYAKKSKKTRESFLQKIINLILR